MFEALGSDQNQPWSDYRTRQSTRRDVLTLVSMLSLNVMGDAVGVSAMAEPADERPQVGDLLVAIESDSPIPLEPKDIPAGGPQLLAWPMDAAGGIVRKGSRLNKVLLLRLDPATLTSPTSDRTAEGVVSDLPACGL